MNKPKKHLILPLFLCVLLLSSCANTVMPTPTPSEVSKSVQEKIEDLVDDLPENVEYVGKTLTVLTSDTSRFQYDESAAGTVKNAVRDRGEALKLAYDMELTAVSCKEEGVISKLQEAEKAGVPVADILCFPAETTVALQLQGLLADMTKLPNFDISDSQTAVTGAKELSFGNALYLLPETCALPYDEAYVLYYNRDLVRATGLPLPEESVRAGDWTFTKCQTYIEAVAAGVMSKSSYDYANDLFGLGCTDNKGLLPDLFRQSADLRMFTSENGRLKFATDYTTLNDEASALKTLYNSPAHYPIDGNDPREAFQNGRLGFYIEKLPYLYTLFAGCSFDYGILPLPKRSTVEEYETGGSEYYTPLSPKACVFSVPKLQNDAGLSGLALTALCTTGGEAFSDTELTTLITLCARDNDQSCMLEVIVNSIAFDFGTIYGAQVSQIKALSSGLFTEVFANGAAFRNEISEKMSSFEKFIGQNFG